MTPTRMTAVRLPADERERLERLAAEQGKSITDLVREGLNRLSADDEPQGLAIEMGDPADPMMQQLAEVADTINHCPDYGECYWNEATGDVWWEACDGDPYPAEPGGGPNGEDVPAGTSFDDITSRFMAVDGVNTVTIEAENPPPDDGSYVQVPQSDVADGEGDGEGAPAPAQAAAEAITLSNGARLLGFTAAPVAPPADAEAEEPETLAEAPTAPPQAAEEGDSPDTAELVGGGKPFSALLAIEGTATDDGRMIEAGALEWRELPLTLMAMIEEPEMGGHAGSQVAGRIDAITRDGANVTATGVFDSGEYGAEIARLVEEKMLRGVSIDLAVKEYEERWGDDVEGGVEDPFFGEKYLLVVLAGTIMGATVCPFPAFADAGIQITASAVLDTQYQEVEGQRYVTGLTVLGEFQPVDAPDVPVPDGGGSVFIGLFPDEAATIADPDGNVPAERLHVTLFADLGGDPDAITQAVDDFLAGGAYGQLAGTVGGAGVFAANTPGGEGEPAETAPDADEGPDGEAPADGAAADADVPQVLIVDAPGLGELRFDLADALEAAGITYATDHDFTPHITTDYDDAADLDYNQGLIGQALTFNAISIVAEDGTRQDVPLSASVTASAAGLAPDKPPTEWFDFPHDVEGVDSGEVVPLTVTNDGRVYGYAALFNECHLARPGGKCTPAPHHWQADPAGKCAVCESTRPYGHSRSWYDYFHLGTVETAEGEVVSCGQITLGKGHASTSLGPKQAMEHYDDVESAVADVRAYETPVGIMVAGALRPWASAQRVRQLRGAKLSGDWRSIKGSHEMVGCLAVNVPGYPVPRVTQAVKEFDGDRKVVALVAAGMVPDEQPEQDKAQELRHLINRARMPQLLARAKESR